MHIRLGCCHAFRDNDCYVIRGNAALTNDSYQKNVQVCHDTGGTWTMSNCHYVRPVSGNQELWAFEIREYAPVGPHVSDEHTRFALRYESWSPSGLCWDNNDGHNYEVGIPGHGGYGWNAPGYAIGYPVMCLDAKLDLDYAAAGRRFHGIVGVKTLAYRKQVTVRYTTDQWRSFTDLDASYGASPQPSGQPIVVNNGEVWSFQTVVPGSVHRIDFAVRYRVAGSEFWDNNFDINHCV